MAVIPDGLTIRQPDSVRGKGQRMSAAVDPVRTTPAMDDTRRLAESRLSRIARRAHEIYEARGGENGKGLQDWLRAEQEIDQEDE